MKENRDEIIAFVIRKECNPGEEMTGSYHCAKGDRGGCTKFGISHTYHPKLDIQNLTRGDAITIYIDEYWNKVDGDNLPSGLDLLIMDFAVTSGPRRAEGVYAKMVEDYKDSPLSGYDSLVNYTNRRRDYYKHIVVADPLQTDNLSGWLERADQALVAAKELIV